MSHPDADELACLALDDAAPSAELRAHLATCAACSADLESLRRAVTAGRARVPADDPRAPGPHVWAAVRDELGLAETPGPLVGDPATAVIDLPVPAADRADRAEVEPAPALPLRAPRRHPRIWAAVAAAAALVVGIAGGIAWADRGRTSTEARAELVALPGWSGSTGTAELQRAHDGNLQLAVHVDAQIPANGFREVWLATPDLSGMVSLGVLDGASATLPVPAGLDVAGYPVVDVSQEPFDGDPAHSAESIVRGKLTR